MLNSVSEIGKVNQENQVKVPNKPDDAASLQLFDFKNKIQQDVGVKLETDQPYVAKNDATALKKLEIPPEKIAKQTVAKVIVNDKARDKNSAYSPVEISDMIVDISKKYDMDYKLVASVIKQETHFTQEKAGSSGKGLMQLTSITVKDLFQRPKIYDEKAQALIQKYKTPQALMQAIKKDPKVNIEMGVITLKNRLASAKGNYNKALINYNGSPQKISYAKSVMNHYKTDYPTS